MKVHLEGDPQPITLDADHFIAEGGQGRVYAREGVAYKIFHDPLQLPPAQKLQALQAIDHPRVLTPQRRIFNLSGQAIGYTQRFVPQASPVGALCPKAFRRRHQITPAIVAALVEDLRQMLCAIHHHKALVVDLNEANFLVAPTGAARWAVYAIDTDSYQVPGFPATAISERIRDRRSPPGHFTEGSDWFAFAVISFQMWCGIHPFLGRHPTVKGIDARMRAGISVLHPEVSVPTAALSFDLLPAAWRPWYRSMFETPRRSPPPPLQGAAPAISAPPAPAPTPAPPAAARQRAAAWLDGPSGPAYAVDDQIWLGGRAVAPCPQGPWRLVPSPKGRPLLVWLDGVALKLLDLDHNRPVPLRLHADALCDDPDHAIAFRSGTQVLSLRLTDLGTQVIAAPMVIGQSIQVGH